MVAPSVAYIDVLVLAHCTIGRRQYIPGTIVRRLPLSEATRLARLSLVELKYGSETGPEFGDRYYR